MKNLIFHGVAEKSDHRLQQPLFIATWVKANGSDVKYGLQKRATAGRHATRCRPMSDHKPPHAT